MAHVGGRYEAEGGEARLNVAEQAEHLHVHAT